MFDRFEKRRTEKREDAELARLKIAKDALARAFDEEAERLNGGKQIEYGSARAEVSPAIREAKDLGSFVRRLDPHDPRIAEAALFAKAGLLNPLDDRCREVLSEGWPGGFDPDAKLVAAVKT
ncbi:MAG: hypothetical protein ACYDHO_07545, partial [Gaiellaceae bacterium]